MKSTPKIYIETYGCQMNEYESDRTYRLFHDAKGYERTDTPETADLVLYNTCSIRDKADQKAFSSLGRLRTAKIANPNMLIAVGGCMAQSRGEEIMGRVPFVDLVFGTHQWERLPSLVDQIQKDRKRLLEIDFYGWRDYRFLPYRNSTAAHPISEYVTIQNGCDKFCTFCLVPYTRGREMSRPHGEILKEVKLLADRGVKEVMLLGQNVNGYGRDRSGEISFVSLLRKISEVDQIKRIRFITSHAAEMSVELMDEMADNEKICEHLHLPLQSGSDRILEKMNRQYTVSDFRKKIEYLKKRIPNLTLTSDMIIGFPSETDVEFEMTLSALSEFQFDDSFSFTFSPRKDTKAAKWESEFIPEEVAKKRLKEFQSVQQEILSRKNSEKVGMVLEVSVEGASKKSDLEMCGKTRHHQTVNFEGSKDWIGNLIPVQIKSVLNYTLRGERVAKAACG